MDGDVERGIERQWGARCWLDPHSQQLAREKTKIFAAVCSETNEQFGAHLIPSYYNV